MRDSYGNVGSFDASRSEKSWIDLLRKKKGKIRFSWIFFKKLTFIYLKPD